MNFEWWCPNYTLHSIAVAKQHSMNVSKEWQHEGCKSRTTPYSTSCPSFCLMALKVQNFTVEKRANACAIIWHVTWSQERKKEREHCISNLASFSTQAAIRGNGYIVEEPVVTKMAGLELAVDEVPYLEHPIPSCRTWLGFVHWRGIWCSSPSQRDSHPELCTCRCPVFQSLIVLSLEAVTIWRLSAENATLVTSLVWPNNLLVVAPVWSPQRRSVPSQFPKKQLIH